MSENLPAKLPPRQRKDVSPQASAVPVAANSPAPRTKAVRLAPALPGMVLARRHFARFVRFASRLTSRCPTPALQSVLFGPDSVLVTDLDVALRASLPGARQIGVLLPVHVLRRCLGASDRPEIHIGRVASNPARFFAASVDGAIVAGHDSGEFPALNALFRESQPIARASVQTLEPVLVAASDDHRDRGKCGVFLQLCENVAVATNGHVLHALGIQSSGRGDFLVPRRAIELAETIRKVTKTRES